MNVVMKNKAKIEEMDDGLYYAASKKLGAMA